MSFDSKKHHRNSDPLIVRITVPARELKKMDLDKKIGIRENLITEVGEQEAEIIWDRCDFYVRVQR